MADYHAIYANDAHRYDALVSREDYQGNLWRALDKLGSLRGLDAVEFGAGTGRLTLPLAARCKHVRAYDNAPAMVAIAKEKALAAGVHNISFDIADNRALPVADASAGIAIAGWSFGHATGWNPTAWLDDIAAMCKELMRVVSPGGLAVIIETLGTGSETPAAPNERLAQYYAWLENNGFARIAVRTDYEFASIAEAVELVSFFFGEARAQTLQSKQSALLPECTGIWWRRI